VQEVSETGDDSTLADLSRLGKSTFKTWHWYNWVNVVAYVVTHKDLCTKNLNINLIKWQREYSPRLSLLYGNKQLGNKQLGNKQLGNKHVRPEQNTCEKN